MGLFKSKEGGFMDVIRCDEPEYLVWKWRPSGEANTTKKENAIRYGSSLRVKDGEVAVFVYNQENGTQQDFIEGPFDKKIETGNFPVLTSIVGLAFGGASPFQAEVYFINLAQTAQIRFAVPFFDVFDPRFLDFSVPVAVRGTITFAIEDYKNFIKINRLINFDLEAFKKQVQSAVIRHVKEIVTNVPTDLQIPVVQLERSLGKINPIIEENLKRRFSENFGTTIKALDISTIEIDKTSENYAELKELTANQVSKTVSAQTNLNIKNMENMQALNLQNMEETARIQREEMQRAQKLQTETNFIGTHALNQQAEVLKTGAQNLGSMGTMNLGSGSGNMNPAGMMTGMMMGGAIGQQMAGMMNNLGQAVQAGKNTPPPLPEISYNVAVNGQSTGPFNMQQLQAMVSQGSLSKMSLVWKAGMAGWEAAGTITELTPLFANSNAAPPIPSVPPLN